MTAQPARGGPPPGGWPAALPVAVVALLGAGLIGARLLPPAVLVLSVPFLVVVARQPVLRRLAARNAARRPREAALVLAGAMLGTAFITGSSIVGDTLDASIRRSAFTQLGPVDEAVLAGDPVAAAHVEQVARGLPPEEVDGVLSVVSAAAAAVAPGTRRAEPQAQVFEVDFTRARAFGGDPAATGIRGPTPAAGEAALSADLARALGVGEGDRLRAHLYGTTLRLRVTQVLPRLGIAGLFGRGSESMNVFVAPGTIGALPPGQAAAPPPVSSVLVSNRGGVIDGAARSDHVARLLQDAVAPLPAPVRTVKADLLEEAEVTGREFTELFGGIGFFSVIAGVLLLVNIFVMLAQERKSELGMLRAVGLRRAGVVTSFSVEGWLYALAASALGTVAGLGVGRLIVAAATGIFATDDEFGSLELHYTANLSSIHFGFTLGFGISLLTVVLTSIGVSRLNVIRAIRDLPEPETPRRRTFTLVLGAIGVVAGGLLTVSSLTRKDPGSLLAAPAVLALGLYPLLARVLPRRPVASVLSVGVIAWAVMAFDLVATAFDDPPIAVFVIEGVILTAAAVGLVSVNQTAIGAFFRQLAGGHRSMGVRLGLAYPLARRFRTGMTLAMYSLVVFTLTFITTFSHIFRAQLDDFTRKISGGFDLMMRSNLDNPAPVAEVERFPGVEAVAPLAGLDAEFRTAGNEEFQFWPAAGFGEEFAERGGPSLSDRGRYPDDASAYRAVLADPGLVIISEFFLQGGGGPPEAVPDPGQPLFIRDPVSGRSKALTVAAVAEAGFGNALAFVSRPAADEVFGPRAGDSLLFVATRPGTDAQNVAERLNARFVEHGADAMSFRTRISRNLGQQLQFFRLMQGYLALGLVVGIAGLGVVMVRAVRERRRQIGILRSLGFEAGSVRRAFVVESAFVAVEGILIGEVLASLTAWRITEAGNFGSDLRFTVPWIELLVLLVTTFAVSLLATAAPAHQASRIRPAVALRIAD